MNCKTAKSLIQDYLERRLVVLDRNEFVRHVTLCAPCERELASYRDVFRCLGGFKAEPVPRGFQNAVISQLKSEGLIHEPRIPVLRRWTSAFLGLPAAAKYPLAAGAVIAALYFPLLVILGRARDFAGSATIFMTESFVSLLDRLGDVTPLTKLFSALGSYGRAVKTVAGACLSLFTALAENPWLLGAGIVTVLSMVLVLSVIVRKRSTHNAIRAR